ncbi:hypothetical protein ID866_10457 [Astraeus odoratus]|nr:hypothetical protein ID866_10457 [Astraeus odoratus]
MRRDGDAALFDGVQHTRSFRVWDSPASRLRHGVHRRLGFWKTRPRRVDVLAEQTPASNLHPHPSRPFQASSRSPPYARLRLSSPTLLRRPP